MQCAPYNLSIACRIDNHPHDKTPSFVPVKASLLNSGDPGGRGLALRIPGDPDLASKIKDVGRWSMRKYNKGRAENQIESTRVLENRPSPRLSGSLQPFSGDWSSRSEADDPFSHRYSFTHKTSVSNTVTYSRHSVQG